MAHIQTDKNRVIERERLQILRQLEHWLEVPMLVLGFAWLALLVVELTWGLTPLLETAGVAIWIIFILDFTLKFTFAPRKLPYLTHNWLTVIALLLPALRVLRLARTMRGLRLVRVLSSLNRGMRALGRAMGRRGFGYVVALTFIVTLTGRRGCMRSSAAFQVA